MEQLLSRNDAQEMLESIISERNSSAHPFRPEWEQEFRAHSGAVAHIAETIASKTLYLNSEKAYILGLLHDCGKYQDEYACHKFHGLAGYYYMLEKGYPDLARASLTHTFYKKDFELNEYPFPPDYLKICRRLLQDIKYDDYDLLLQLSDMINDMGKTCTIEYRIQSVCTRRNITPKNYAWVERILKNIKHHFDQQCGCDIYSMFDILK